eukprot:4355569-Prymnesium_polylepis.2
MPFAAASLLRRARRPSGCCAESSELCFGAADRRKEVALAAIRRAGCRTCRAASAYEGSSAARACRCRTSPCDGQRRAGRAASHQTSASWRELLG